MEMVQFITIMVTILGSVFASYKLTNDRIDRMENYHREDIERMDTKWSLAIEKMDTKWSLAIEKMDAKWERLFEKLLIKEGNNK